MWILLIACAPATLDADGDGWPIGGDCDDDDPQVWPGAPEVCDGLDSNCNGTLTLDEHDGDGDGWPACNDCDDANPGVHPFAADPCDGADQDCDGAFEGDADRDGFVGCANDCDDGDPLVHPGAEEAECDGADTDCDGVRWSGEQDSDGDGHLPCDDDCNDADAHTYADAVELCGDGVDQDCDGVADTPCFDCTLVVPDDAATIQEGIDAAPDGAVVCVAAGTYAEHVDFHGRSLTLLGTGGRDRTVLKGSGEGTVAQFVSGEGAGAVLDGFTISGAVESGIRIVGSSPTLQNLRIQDNLAEGVCRCGGGVYVEDGAPTLSNLVVTKNLAGFYSGSTDPGTGLGGGLYLDGAQVVLDNVLLDTNVAGEDGGGIYADDSDIVATHVVVRTNGALAHGGGIYLLDSSARFTNLTVSGNWVSDSYADWSPPGGGVVSIGSELAVENALIVGNAAMGGGAAIYAGTDAPSFVNVVVADSTCDDGYSAIVVDTEATFSHCDLWNNATTAWDTFVSPVGTEGNVSVDPIFRDSTYHLESASTLLDAGDPSILDPDGSISDIGAFGGPGADGWDLDGDGFSAWWKPGPYDAASSLDCDDEDATVFPGNGC